MNDLTSIGVNALYLLALINPISKVSILTLLPAGQRDSEFVSLGSKWILMPAMAILLALGINYIIMLLSKSRRHTGPLQFPLRACSDFRTHYYNHQHTDRTGRHQSEAYHCAYLI